MATATQLLRRTGIEVIDYDKMSVFKTTKATAADILAYGDLVDLSSGEALLTDAADASEIGGVCLDDSPGTDNSPDEVVTIARKALLRVPLSASAGAIVPGDGLAWSTGQTVAQRNAGTVVAFTVTDTLTEAVLIANEIKAASAGGTILATLDVMWLKALDTSVTTIETITVA